MGDRSEEEQLRPEPVTIRDVGTVDRRVTCWSTIPGPQSIYLTSEMLSNNNYDFVPKVMGWVVNQLTQSLHFHNSSCIPIWCDSRAKLHCSGSSWRCSNPEMMLPIICSKIYYTTLILSDEWKHLWKCFAHGLYATYGCFLKIHLQQWKAVAFK